MEKTENEGDDFKKDVEFTISDDGPPAPCVEEAIEPSLNDALAENERREISHLRRLVYAQNNKQTPEGSPRLEEKPKTTVKKIANKVTKPVVDNVDQAVFIGFGFVCHWAGLYFWNGDYKTGGIVLTGAVAVYLINLFLPQGAIKDLAQSKALEFLMQKSKESKVYGAIEKSIFRRIK